MEQFDIDFVVIWLDANDPLWQAEKAKYLSRVSDDDCVIRYQDWNNFRYWFRAIAKFAPWVNKIHLVTCGQVPPWLNMEHPQIHLVRHSDYMPLDALPTFNSTAIEVGIHNIPELAEHFVFFNDDMFLTAPIEPAFYFENGVPVDMPGLSGTPKRIPGNVFSFVLANNSRIIYRNFSRKELFRGRWLQWLNPVYGKTFLRTLRWISAPDFPGFVMPHLSAPYVKHDFEKVWAKEEEVLRSTQNHKFRCEEDLSHFLMRNWRMCENAFVPRRSTGRYFAIDGTRAAERAAKAIRMGRYPEICINETCSGEMFERVKEIINRAFEDTLGEPCEFEVCNE